MAFDEAAFGNSVITEVLDLYLREAKDKPFGFVGVFMLGFSAQNQPIAAVDCAGSPAYDIASLEAVKMLERRLQKRVDSWMLPPPNPDLDASYVVWNMAHCPLGFDFITWLVSAELRRQRLGAPGPLKVGFYLGKEPLSTMRQDNREQWLNNVFRPAMDMLGVMEDPIDGIFGYEHKGYTPSQVVKAWKDGFAVPLFRSGLPPRRPHCITITLREAGHWVKRNSNLETWLHFARDLKEQGEDVVFVRDTRKAEEPIDGFPIDPEASIDLKARVNLYEGAKCNLCVGGGPWQMLLYGTAPWLALIPLDEDPHGYEPNSRLSWHKSMGVEAGEQFPWQTANQRIVWLDDSYDNIRTAWESLPLNHLGNRHYGT